MIGTVLLLKPINWQDIIGKRYEDFVSNALYSYQQTKESYPISVFT